MPGFLHDRLVKEVAYRERAFTKGFAQAVKKLPSWTDPDLMDGFGLPQFVPDAWKIRVLTTGRFIIHAYEVTVSSSLTKKFSRVANFGATVDCTSDTFLKVHVIDKHGVEVMVWDEEVLFMCEGHDENWALNYYNERKAWHGE